MGYLCWALAVVWLFATAGAALAEERLVMPFRCDAHGGGVSLVPADDQSYRIHGARQTQLFSSCSPDNPDRCRHWRLHKFDLDCNGVRVPWVEVAAAGSTREGVRVEDGSLILRTAPAWAERRDVPRRRWWRERWNSRFDDRHGHDPRNAAAEIVEFPAGFAPSLGIQMQFVGEPNPPASAKAADAQVTKQAPSSALKPPAPKPVQKEGKSPTPAAAKEAKTVPVKPPEPSQEQVSGKQIVAGGSVPATIINAPQSQQLTEPPSTPPAVTDAAPPDQATVEQVSPQPPEANPISTGSLKEDVGLSATGGVPVQIAWLGAAAVLMLLSYYFWSRRSDRAQHAGVRDLGAISLGELRRGRGLTVRGSQPSGAVALSANLQASDPAMGGGPIVMPSTIAEALQVLGTSPDASPQAIKKIVDGLRQSWHPDLAKSEDDRRLREQRLAQINVAWDILSGRQSAA